MDAAACSTTIPWVVQIWLHENHQFLGNGILVTPDAVVSTFHQLFLDDEGSSDNRFIKPTRPLSVGLGGTDHDVAAICSNQDLDLAILKLARSTAVRPARFVADPGDTDSISAAVYGWLKTGDQTTLERRTDKIEITRTVEGRYWSFESGMPHGFSGSPLVFHPEGHAAVGGMVRLGRDGAAISVAIPARAICDFLRDNQVPFRTSNQAELLYDAVICHDPRYKALAGTIFEQLDRRGEWKIRKLSSKKDAGQSLFELRQILPSTRVVVLLLSSEDSQEWPRSMVRECVLESVRRQGALHVVPVLAEGEPTHGLR